MYLFLALDMLLFFLRSNRSSSLLLLLVVLSFCAFCLRFLWERRAGLQGSRSACRDARECGGGVLFLERFLNSTAKWTYSAIMMFKSIMELTYRLVPLYRLYSAQTVFAFNAIAESGWFLVAGFFVSILINLRWLSVSFWRFLFGRFLVFALRFLLWFWNHRESCSVWGSTQTAITLPSLESPYLWRYFFFDDAFLAFRTVDSYPE